jgi:asparagine synthase (glutamine-hydrolysing)
MFAFAAYDPRDGRLVLARDRLGQKPLFFRRTAGCGLLFASEIGALLALSDDVPEPDEEALSLFLAFGYVPAPWSAYAGIRKLPAGHLLRSGGSEPARYWRRPAPDTGADGRGDREEIRERIRDAVRSRLVSDVPLGAFLSGGLDSSTVVAFMAEAGAGPVRTFTIKNPDPEYDESALAREVAERFGTDHTEIRIDPPEVEEIPSLLGRWGEPFGDSSALPTALVSRAARDHVTVALTGDGGDEVFGGYDRHSVLSRVGRIPRLAGRALAPLLPGRPGRVLELAGMEPWRRYYEFYESFNAGLRASLLTPRFAARWGDAPARFLERLYRSQPGGELDKMLGTDAETWLPDDLNLKVDTASMAVALECRSPLQDHLLVERCARIPASRHVRGGRKKALLKEAMGDLLPASVLSARKRGFAAPVERWFEGDLRGFLGSKLGGRALRELDIVRPEAVEGVVRSLDTGSRHGHPRIQVFILLALAIWAEGLS